MLDKSKWCNKLELGTRKFVGIFNQPWSFLIMMFMDLWQNHYLNIVSLFGKTSPAVSDWVFRRKLYFTQLDKLYVSGRDTSEREREREKEGDRDTERELIKNGCEKRSEILKYFYFCVKIFLHESSSSRYQLQDLCHNR